MSNARPLPKPNSDITDYEWEVTPYRVKIIFDSLQQILQQKQENLKHVNFENQWLRQKLDERIERTYNPMMPSLPEVILWAIIGFILTVGCTFIEAHTLNFPWLWNDQALAIPTLGVSYQIGAVLFVGCIAGRNAALLSQAAYVILGICGVPIFERGGGWQYILEPNFGYLVGFIIGAWLCGYLAFQKLVYLDGLIMSCGAGLLAIHATGIIYLTVLYYTQGLGTGINSLMEGISLYSLALLPGQLAVICATVVISYGLRKLMFS
ncbi:MAG: biotin transporter BioY [Cyanobacteria bacterium P01_F01_bin.143]